MQPSHSRRVSIVLLTVYLIALCPSLMSGAILFSTIQEGATTTDQPISANNWSAQRFTTDNQSYALGPVSLSLGDAVADGGHFTVSLWSGNDAMIQSHMIDLIGSSAPNTAGTYIYTPPGTIVLNPDTSYWIVAGVYSGSGVYQWTSLTGTSPPAIGGATRHAESTDQGFTWAMNKDNIASHLMVVESQFVVSPVPEPKEMALMASLGLMGFAAWRRYYSIKTP